MIIYVWVFDSSDNGRHIHDGRVKIDTLQLTCHFFRGSNFWRIFFVFLENTADTYLASATPCVLNSFLKYRAYLSELTYLGPMFGKVTYNLKYW